EISAITMHATCRRHAPWRIKYQPAEINTVLTKLSEALIAGRSEMEGINSTFNAQRSASNAQSSTTRRALSRPPEWRHLLLFLPRRSSHVRRLLKTCRTIESLKPSNALVV